MAKRVEVKTGDKYGRLMIIKEIEPHITPCGKKRRKVLVQCSCGNSEPFEVLLDNLRNGNTSSCGCYNKQRISEANLKKVKTNEYDLSNNIGIGYTFKCEKFYFDKEDYSIIKNYCWYIDNNGYVMSRERGTGKRILLHRLVMNAKDNEVVDHADHKPTNNCKSNLRICTQTDNAKNRNAKKGSLSGVTGVTWDKRANKWRVIIMVNGKNIYLGLFTLKAEAVKARIKAELEFYKEYASTYNYFTEEQRQAILNNEMSSEEIVKILNQKVLTR